MKLGFDPRAITSKEMKYTSSQECLYFFKYFLYLWLASCCGHVTNMGFLELNADHTPV